ncbi:hypothetical protein ACEPAI_3177 [Sanghuangporus weigelae]
MNAASTDDIEPVVPLAERIVAPLRDTSSPHEREPDPMDLEKVRKWQEERIERKLRGEYESVLLRLGELIRDNAKTPMRITSVRVDGANKTRSSFLHWVIEPQLTRAKSDSSTLSDVLFSTKSVARKLLETDLFHYVLPRLEGSKDVLAQPGDVDLILQTRQKGKYFLKTATELGNQEGSVSVHARARNAFGSAETVEGVLSSGLRTRLAGHVSLSKPIWNPDLRTRGELSVFGVEKDFTGFASCVEGVRGLRASIKTVNRRTLNEIAYEASLRHIHALTEGASISIREEAGTSVKSALSHSWTHESRDDKAVPSRGGYLRTFNELAGLGGNTAHVKHSTAFQLAHKLLSSTSISLSGRVGCLFPFASLSPSLFSSSASIPRSRFNDRFQLGGPLDVRMFKQNGLGFRDGNDALGGEVFWCLGLSVIRDLPGLSKEGRKGWKGNIKMHGFVNAGRLDLIDRDRPLSHTIQRLVSKPCISAGVGLLYRLDPGVRVEFNFGVPLVANKGDAVRRGVQVGIGVDFL